jgi:ankyrin repeat protein
MHRLLTTVVSLRVKTRAFVQVAELLDSGALSLESLDHAGRTLLHVAVRACNSQLVQMLLDRGCPLKVLDMYGCTPLQLARMVRT